MTTNTARNAVAAAIASALALGIPCAPALAAEATTLPDTECAIVAQSSIIGSDLAELTACAWLGWDWSDVDYVDTYLVYDAFGEADYYEVNISAWFTGDIYTVYVDAYTGGIR